MPSPALWSSSWRLQGGGADLEGPAIFSVEAPGPDQVRVCWALSRLQWFPPAAAKVCFVIEPLAHVGAGGLHLGQRKNYRFPLGIVVGKKNAVGGAMIFRQNGPPACGEV